MTLLNVPTDGIGLVGGRAGGIPIINDQGLLVIGPNAPGGQGAFHYSEYENGSAGQLGQGLNAWVQIGAAAGVARTPLTGEPGWFQCAASLETGTTATGSIMLNRSPAAISFSSTSALWAYEATFSIPVLSDGTDTFMVQLGFLAPSFVGATGPFHGAVLFYTHTVNSGKFQFITAIGGVNTAVDTGVTLVAGNYYHVRIEVLNDTLATCYLKTTFSGGAWSDNGVWTTPVATSSTNIPTATSRVMFPGPIIRKSVGTASRKLKLGYQMFTRDLTAAATSEPVRFIAPGKLSGGDGVGRSLGGPNTTLAITPQGTPGWLPSLRLAHPIVYHAYGRGGWVTSPPHDFGFTVGGAGSVSGSTLDNGMPFGVTNVNSGNTSSSFAAFHAATAVTIDASVQPLVFETVFNISTLSTSGQQCVTQLGFVDSVTVAPVSGVWIEIDSVANVAAQCKCSQSGTATTTSSGLTIAATTNYVARIVATSTSVNFWIKVDDGSAFGSPVATIATNIPTATLAPAMIQRNTSGTTSHVVKFAYLLAFSRSTT